MDKERGIGKVETKSETGKERGLAKNIEAEAIEAAKPITESPIILQGGKFMNPLKWSVWIRIAVVVSVLWPGLMYVNAYLMSHYPFSYRYYNFWVVFLTILLFWGGAWIVHGIRLWHIRKKGKGL